MTKKSITKKNVQDAIVAAIPTARVSVTVHTVGNNRHSAIHPTICVNIHPRAEGQDGRAIIAAAKAFAADAHRPATWSGKPFDCEISVHITNPDNGRPVMSVKA